MKRKTIATNIDDNDGSDDSDDEIVCDDNVDNENEDGNNIQCIVTLIH